MSERSLLSVDISDLIGKPGTSKELHLDAQIDGLAVAMAHVPEESVLELDLRLDSLLEGILVSGTVRGRLRAACRRCAAERTGPIEVDVSEVVAFEGAPAADDQYRVSGSLVELEGIVRDAVVLALPLNPLCRAECRGLCPVCGEDRNVVECGHDIVRRDPRWAPLERIRRQLGGE